MRIEYKGFLVVKTFNEYDIWLSGVYQGSVQSLEGAMAFINARIE